LFGITYLALILVKHTPGQVFKIKTAGNDLAKEIILVGEEYNKKKQYVLACAIFTSRCFIF
jgi:hypothetical protein